LFLDEVSLDVTAGAGGRGSVSFRHEKYVPHGGPDGGDGGAGGSVILTVDGSETTLGRYRDRRLFRAPDGKAGGRALRSGPGGQDLVLPVPPGTVVRDAESGELIGDLVTADQRLVVVAGGRGGRGNTHFASATRQAPRIGELGERGQQRRIHLELKLIADVGLVGLPNAGKSTLLAALTGARPKVAAYPFTTLQPNLGVAELSGGRTLVLADVPGLIEGAHLGAGLGIDFLRHLERTRVLVHVVDCSLGAAEARLALRQVELELAAFSPTLAARPALVAFNKTDLPGGADVARDLAAEIAGSHQVSAANREGTEDLLVAVAALVAGARRDGIEAEASMTGPGREDVDRTLPGTWPASEPLAEGGHRLYKHTPRRAEIPVVVREQDGAYRVISPTVEKMVERTDLEEEDAVSRLQRRLLAGGVDAALAAAGCKDGDSVRIGEIEFTYADGMAAPDARPPRRGR
jgi:GTP-binding protein